MGYYRQLRRKDELHITGPCVVRVECGRPCVTVEAPRETKIAHKKRKRLTRLPRKR